MDREISAEQLSRQLLRKRLRAALILILFVLGIWTLRSLLRPSLDREDIRTARVERGEIRASVSAAGQVVPMEEQIVSALFDSEVVEVLETPGSVVEVGQPILRLDARKLELELADLREQLALKENLRRTERLTLDQTLDSYRSRLELLAIDLQSREAKLARYQTLASDGAISNDQLFEAELDVTRTSVEIGQLERSIGHAEAAAGAQLERVDLETSILKNQLAENQRQLTECLVRAPQAGVVTWSLEEVGTRVNAGTALARVADLSVFRVEAQVSDFYASRLHSGLPVEVLLGEERLAAIVAGILPTVDGGQMTLQVDLERPDFPGLRPQLRVDVEVITGRVADALGVKNGPALGSNVHQTVYRIVDGVAARTEVRLGIASRYRVQVLEGLEEGDEVILSDTRDIDHLEQIRVE